MAADLPLPEHVFVHGFLLMDGEKMSKSLGNVLDPFEIIDHFGTDALRYYLLRDVSFGQDGSVSTEALRGAATRASWPTTSATSPAARSRWSCATATARVPAGRPRRRRSPPTSPGSTTASRELLDRAELTAALEAIWQRVRRLNRYVEEQAPWKLAKDEARAADLDRVLRSLAEGLRVVAVLLPRGSRAPRKSCWRRSARPATTTPPRATAPAPSPGSRRSSRCSRSTTPSRDRQPHPPRVVRAARRRARRGRARGRRHAHAHRRHGRGQQPRGARRRRAPSREVFAAIGRHPNDADGLRRRRPRRARRRSRTHPRCARDRRDRAGLLPRLRAARRPGARLPRPDRARPRDRQAARHPHARGRGRHDRDAARARRRARRDPALLLDARPPRRVPRPRAGGSRSPATSPTPRRPTSPRPPSACPTTACSSRPTRRTSRRRSCARSATSRRSSRTPRASSPSGAAIGLRGARRRGRAQRRRAVRRGDRRPPDPAEPAPAARVRRAPQARPRPELPHRLEHPRRHRACGGARRPTTSCSRSAAASASSASTSRRASRTCTSSSSTARSSRRCATRSTPFRNATLHVADAMTLDLRGARPGADEGRREPALRHRGGRDPAHDRGARRRHALGGDGPAGGRRALRGRAGHRGLRRAQRARPARLRRARAPRRLAHRLPPGAERRLGARRAASARGPAPPPALRALVQAAFAHRRKALARSLVAGAGRRPGRARARRATALVGARPPGRRARRAALAGGLPRARGGPASVDRPSRAGARRRSTSACSSARRAPTAATSSSPSCSR